MEIKNGKQPKLPAVENQLGCNYPAIHNDQSRIASLKQIQWNNNRYHIE
jgi:hypothetical protein